MAVNYVIAADVVDVSTDTPVSSDRFIVDTCVWFWLTYTRASHGESAKAQRESRHYPAYISRAKSAGSQLHCCGLSFSELAHIIERKECRLFSRNTLRLRGELPLKQFRYNHSGERPRVVGEIRGAWGQVKGLSTHVDLTVNEKLTDAALSRCATQALDGYDLFILETAHNTGIKQVVTNDGDFATVPDITVFTANELVLELAKQQGKLVMR